MPGLGRYPCSSCHYVASNRRMLARHAVLIHSVKVFKCPVCPFITRYAANWYRHKRDLHGLTKITNCEVCGFFANSTAELAKHKETEHPEHLQLEKYEDKYAKEKLRLGGSLEEPSQETAVEELICNLQPDITITEITSDPKEELSLQEQHESITLSLPNNALLDSNGDSSIANGDEEENLSHKVAMSNEGLGIDALRPLKVKRSYNCERCGLLTSNPREYLYHLRSTHGEKISVFECKYCIYASKHVQKLHRHCNLVHRQLIAKDPDYQKQLEASKERRAKPGMNRLGIPLPPSSVTVNDSFKNSNASAFNKPLIRSRSQQLFKCSTCPYQTRNKGYLAHHEKTVHLKKRFYRCLQCGYYTNDRARYTKHIKYHNLPKMQCEFCFFKTAYKWNMDRHMKNHENGAEGAFHCTACNFTTSTKQSFKSHVTNHHNNASVEDFLEPDGDIVNGQNDSAEWEDIDEMQEAEDSLTTPDENGSMESYEFSEPRETSETVWKDGKIYQKTLQCSFCDFKAAWPFELKKHEENHKSQKKHPCPLCGMRFEHIAWLTKHLRRVHQENSQAKNIAAAFDLLKPARRRPGKEYAADTVLPIFQEVLKHNNTTSKASDTNKGSMLSTLLNKPLQPFMPTSMNKFNSTYKSKTFASTSNMSRQLRLSNFYEKVPGSESSNTSAGKPKVVPTCNVCGYKTRWISELQRHMRVHSQEKPFHCPKCKYHCKWKGDLNRHLMKYHGIKVPSSGKKHGFPRLKPKKPAEIQNTNDWSNQSANQENKRNQFTTSTPGRNPDQDGPLDLTLTKETFPNSYPLEDTYDPYDFETFSSTVEEESLVDVESVNEADPMSNFKSPLQHLREASFAADDSSNNASAKRKYQCPFCSFGTTTASRFHVHIVQHYNRRPFMCSVCGYNSNWEWDITKHIRLKGCRDEFHNKACVLLTDETGRRNYEKYEKYLVDINEPPPAVPSSKPADINMSDIDTRYNLNRPINNETAKSCTYDFRNIGSNFEDAPENIVVTPDINIPDPPEMETTQNFYGNQPDVPDNISEKGYDAKCFFCKHCNFKHATKRVVISHLSVHAGIKPFRCRACGITSNWRHVIVRHVKDAHNGYMNEVEDRISYVQEGFALRLTSINSSNQGAPVSTEKVHLPQFGCKICPYKCDKEFYIKFHMKQHRPREGAIYRCDYCPYFVKFKKTLVRHTKLHCPSPTDTATINENMDTDENGPFNQADTDPQQNDVYDFYDPQVNDSEDSIAISFDTLNQYSNSEPVSPQKIKRHVCESCPYKTDNKTQYLYHKQFHRPNPSAPFKCTVCTYWATMQHLLTQHMKVHSDSEPEPDQSSARNKGIKTAAEKSPPDDDWAEKMSVIYVKRGDLIVKMFKCKFCPMMNKKKANVRVHQKMHGVIVNNGRFACSYCDYQCLNQGGLTNHLKIHQKVPEKEAFVETKEMAYDSSRKSETTGDEAYVTRKKFFSYFCMKCPALFKSSNDLEIHSKFHGSSLPFACTYCDYRARHKPHLFKHLTVHTPEYESKRNASQGPPVGFDNENSSNSDPMLAVNDIPIVKKIDQMLLLEASEVNGALKKTGEAASNLLKCVFCPAPFFKTSTLTYHISLHGSEGEFKCSQCDYAVNRSSNLAIHSQVHPKKKQPVKPKKMPLRSFPCPSCPAIFYKQDRYERHLNLHGKNYRFACEHCDYSVRFAANLIKHRTLHTAKADVENSSSPVKASDNSPPISVSPAAKPLTENTNLAETDEKKITFICDRCPYFQGRKDAVQSHQRRHWLRDGFKCPYCDYTSMQSGFVQSHIKMHIQPQQLFPAQAFMKFDSFKIICKNGSDETLLFDDQEMLKEKSIDSNSDNKSKKKRKTEESHERRKIRKLSCDFEANDSSSSDFSSKPKVPVVVLSDILSNDKDLQKWAPKLKIPKLKITKCSDSSSSEKIYSKINISYSGEEEKSPWSKSKPSLVVKISKVENCNNNDKTIYSVSTKSPELSPDPVSKNAALVENNDSPTSRESNAPMEMPAMASPVPEYFDECTLASTAEIKDSAKQLTKMSSDEGTDREESENHCQPNADSDMKSEESFSSDTVPENIDNCLSEKLSILTELSFNQDISLKNGESDNHLLNGLGLLPDEVGVKL